MHEHVDTDTGIMTDGARVYDWVGQEYAGHDVSDHASGVYVDGDIYTNTVESKFSLLKRGFVGTFHHLSKTHLPRASRPAGRDRSAARAPTQARPRPAGRSSRFGLRPGVVRLRRRNRHGPG